MSGYKLLLPTEYTEDLVRSIDAATERIDIIALVVSEDEMTHDIIEALCRAGRRGVHVSIGLDTYFTFKELAGTASRWAYFRDQVRSMKATRKKLQKHGIKVRWLGQFGATFFSRRTHIKWSIVDNVVYSFGGINLYAEGLHNNDFFLRREHPKLAERLASEHDTVINTDKAGVSYPSHHFSIDNDRILIDGGRMFDSIIYRTACDLAKQAERIVYVSQYCPTGKLSRILKSKDTQYYFNNWRNAEDSLNSILILASSTFHRIKTSYQKKSYLHAKFVLFYMSDGSVQAITGSHNFVASGGTLGTREIALLTSDGSVIRQLENFLQTQIID
jgi:cardiolipin synthase